jgi:hypothetical protein
VTKRRAAGIVAAGALLAASAARADYVVNIHFDTAPGGAPIANGDVVDTLYAARGVTFSAIGSECGSNGHAYASTNRIGGDAGSLPNVVTTCDGSGGSDIAESFQGSVATSFTRDAASVCINVLLPADVAVLRIYDAQDAPLGTVFSPGGEGFLCASSASGIRGATFSGSLSSYARFDDLEITFVPEPGGAVAGLLALAILAAISGAKINT